MKSFRWIACTFLIFTFATARAQSRMTYDAQCITIDGHDTLVFSGAFHYFRCPKELWAQRFRKLKEAGFNTVETYTAWNYHEQTPPENVDDFSHLDMTELHDWLAMAIDDFGFNVVLRPGPYICAEWDGGGYPQWLVTKKPASYSGNWMRSDEPVYLEWCKHWYSAVAKVAAPFQITHRAAGKPGIILWQIENEANYSKQRPETMRGQLVFLAHASRDLGIDVPLTTCMTSSDVYRNDEYLRSHVIETRNTYPGYSTANMGRDIGLLDTYQPDKFHMVTELQGGWFLGTGDKVSRHSMTYTADQITHVTLYAWERGFTSTNYYMAFGGTNFGDWAAAGLTTTYDYQAPIREPGGVGERYLAVKALGDFLKQHGDQLVRAMAEKIEIESPSEKSVSISARRAKDGSRFVFIRNDDEKNPHRGTAGIVAPGAGEMAISYDLAPFGSKVLFLPADAKSASQGTWYPQPTEAPNRPAPSDLPAAVQIAEVRVHDDAGPSSWKALESPEGLPYAGIMHRNFVWYRAIVPALPASGDPNAITWSVRDGDWVGVEIDGTRLAPGKNGAMGLPPEAAGKQLVALYENVGRSNGGVMDDTPGIIDPTIGPMRAGATIRDWRMKIVTNRKSPPELKSDVDSSWTETDVTGGGSQLQPEQAAVFRATMTVDPGDIGSAHWLRFGRIDDEGDVYVDGKRLTHTKDWSRTYRIKIPDGLLHAGENQLAVLVINHDGGGGLGMGVDSESRAAGIATKWEISDQSQGVAGNWSAAEFDDSSGRAVPVGSAARDVNMLTWYRMHFSLPAPREQLWVPWKLKVNAKGNGFLYLNGHALGRYWENGPQREFYLPECWLNFGQGKSNTIALSLRPLTETSIESASVEPYAEQAEVIR